MLLAIFLLAWDLTAIESVDVRRRMWRPRDPEIIHSIQQTTQTTLFTLKRASRLLNEFWGEARVQGSRFSLSNANFDPTVLTTIVTVRPAL